jgi:hypothetical protein
LRNRFLFNNFELIHSWVIIMIRKILISTFIVLGIVILVMAYFFLQKRTIKAPNPLSAIGQDVALVLYSNNTAGILDKFLFENIFWEEFSTTAQFKDFQKNWFLLILSLREMHRLRNGLIIMIFI